MKKKSTPSSDIRRLFNKLAVRPAAQWLDLPVAMGLEANQIQALQSLPVVDIDATLPDLDFGKRTPPVFIARVNYLYYYIDARGSPRTRRAFRLPEPPRKLRVLPFKVVILVAKNSGQSHKPEVLDLDFGITAEYATEKEAVHLAEHINDYAKFVREMEAARLPTIEELEDGSRRAQN